MNQNYEEHGDPNPKPLRFKSQGIRSKISTARRDKEKQTHRGVLFIDCVPRSTKRAFKAACVAKGKTGESMRDAIIRLMRFYALHQGVIPGQEEEDGD